MKIAVLGPEGTFSHQAANLIDKKAEIVFVKTIRDVFEAVSEGKADKGVVPVENSVGGAVNFTLDALLDFDLNIEAEQIIPVIHHLMAPKEIELSEIKTLYLHEQTFSQCEDFIRKNMASADVVETLSNGESAKRVKENGGTSACMGPEIAAYIYGLKVIRSAVQDNRFNVTRFFVISNTETKPTGYDRTSVTVYPQIDRPGLLWEIFNTNKINLTKIESRPSKGKLGDYVFYLDFEGHIKEEKVKKALGALEKMAFVKALGSYERKY